MAPARDRHHSTGCNCHTIRFAARGLMHHVLSPIRWILAGVALVAGAAIFDRARNVLTGRGTDASGRRPGEVLPSLYDVHPAATRAPRRPVGVRSVPLERIVGTMRRPSQNRADFLPLPHLRGQNWNSRWQRITKAMSRLDLLPPVDLVQVGDDYWVEDGHNRVAAALRSGAVEIDADVIQLLLPDVRPSERGWVDVSSMVGGEQLRQAAVGRHSRTVEQRTTADSTSRSDLLRRPGDPAREPHRVEELPEPDPAAEPEG